MNNSEDITAIKANQLVKEFESFKRLAEERAKKIAKEDELRRQSSVIKYDSRWVEQHSKSDMSSKEFEVLVYSSEDISAKKAGEVVK